MFAAVARENGSKEGLRPPVRQGDRAVGVDEQVLQDRIRTDLSGPQLGRSIKTRDRGGDRDRGTGGALETAAQTEAPVSRPRRRIAACDTDRELQLVCHGLLWPYGPKQAVTNQLLLAIWVENKDP